MIIQSEKNNFCLFNDWPKTSSPKEKPSFNSYQDDALSLQERNFESLFNLAKKRLSLMGHSETNASEKLYDSLNRGTAILQKEEQVDKYVHAFGRKHYVKFMTLFESVPSEIFNGFFDLVDWGCGPGLGIIAINDFCRKKLHRSIESGVRRITLIEPSEVALERAKTHVKLLFPESEVTVVKKRFEELISSDFSASALGVPRLHLFSNILDLGVFGQEKKRKQIFDLIKGTFCWDEYFLCVSPSYNNVEQTFMSFISSLSDADLQLERVLEPTEKIFTKEADGCEVKMTAVAVRARSRKAQERLGCIKNIQLLSALNEQRDSTPEQRNLVQCISRACSDAEYDILYRPNFMGDSPDMLILKKGNKAKLIYVCDIADTTTDSLNEVIRIAHMADSLKRRLYNLLSNSLIKAVNNSKSAFGLVTCALFIPKLAIGEAELKALLVDAELKLHVHKNQSENKNKLIGQLKNGWNYRELYSNEIKLRWKSTAMMTESIYIDLKNLLVPKSNILNQGKITFEKDPKIASIATSFAGSRKKVFGVFGSGKTTVMIARAISAYKRIHSRVLILTFNITLRGYIEDMLLRQFGSFNRNQFYVVNFHEFIKGECNYIGETHDIPYNDYDFFKKKLNKFRKYSAIFIDEAQDYSINWFRIIADVFLAKNGEYVLFGDEKQNIYGMPIDKKDRKINTNIPGKPTTLSACFRSNHEITDKVSTFQKKMFALKYENNEIECCAKNELFAGQWGKTGVFDIGYGNVKLLVELILKLHQEYAIPYSDIAVLGTSIKLLRLCEKGYREVSGFQSECMFIKQDEFEKIKKKHYEKNETQLKLEIDGYERGLKLHFDVNKDVIKFSTIHSYKGFESNTIIVIIQSQIHEKEDSERELIYTGLTRARKNLFIINYGRTRYGDDLKLIFGSCLK